MTKILLVEDSKFMRLTTERALARAGYEVSSASDGDEALRMAQAKLPDLILLDMLLPKMSEGAEDGSGNERNPGGRDYEHGTEECGPVGGGWRGGVPGERCSRPGKRDGEIAGLGAGDTRQGFRPTGTKDDGVAAPVKSGARHLNLQ
jgi:hypothetical protein